jgi:soluble cytochrome b562
MKYVPDQVKGLEDGLKSAKDAFAKKDYKAALAAVKDIPAKAKDLAAAAAAKKGELTKAWEDMSGGLPKMVEAIKSRVDILSKSKKLPAGMDQAKFDGAKSGLTEITQMWDDAQKAFQGGNLADAVSKANTVKDKAAQIMDTLGMKAPAAAAPAKKG